jgi:hypothetical protein
MFTGPPPKFHGTRDILNRLADSEYGGIEYGSRSGRCR